MSVLSKLASAQGTKSQEPNKQLATRICRENDKEAVKTLVENLKNTDVNIQSDCAGMMEYIGYLKPEMISSFVKELLDALGSRNNRVVWGVMIALSTIAQIEPAEIFSIKD
jgi:uncharacterized membrane protein YvbJ